MNGHRTAKSNQISAKAANKQDLRKRRKIKKRKQSILKNQKGMVL